MQRTTVGVVTETTPGERRVALVLRAVALLMRVAPPGHHGVPAPGQSS